VRNSPSLSKRLSCVIVRKCVYTSNFSLLQMKHLDSSRNERQHPNTKLTHRRTITHDLFHVASGSGDRLSYFQPLEFRSSEGLC
jgi:hypothetical protein